MEIEGCSVPDDLLVDVENGIWVRPSDDGSATLGLLAPFIAFAGRLTAIGFRPADAPLDAGRSVATIESSRLTAAVRTPVAGELLAQNRSLIDRPRTVHDDPYGAGWFVRFRPREDPAGRVPRTREAREALARQIQERRIRCYAALPDVEVYEIGAECRAILVRLDEELAGRAPGDVVLLVVDDPTAPLEMIRWSDRTGHTVLEQRRADGLFHFLVRKVEHPVPRGRPGPG